jgi:hypothetical protein
VVSGGELAGRSRIRLLYQKEPAMSRNMHHITTSVLLGLAVHGVFATAFLLPAATGAAAQADPRTMQLRLLCARLSGDLTSPGGVAAFRRCLTRDPVNEIKRDNNLGGGSHTTPDRQPPKQ